MSNNVSEDPKPSTNPPKSSSSYASSDSSTDYAPSTRYDDGSKNDVVNRATINEYSDSSIVDNDDPVKTNLCKSNKSSLRLQLGESLSNLSDIINSNLIIVRYATASTVFLLGIYGIANTPLFYRYTSVTDIPTSHFIRRKWIHGRIVGVLENRYPMSGISAAGNIEVASTRQSNSENWKESAGLSSLLSSSLRGSISNVQNEASTSKNNEHQEAEIQNVTITKNQTPITILFRHSSPMERLLTQSAFEKFTAFTGKTTPSRLLYSSANPHRNLLAIELAGVVAPPVARDDYGYENVNESFTSTSSTPSSGSSLFHQLAEKKTSVSLQLLAQRTLKNKSSSSNSRYHLHDVDESNKMPPSIIDDDVTKHTAICHLHYRTPNQWITTTNVTLEAVEKGQACVSKEGMVLPLSFDMADCDIYSGDENVFESKEQYAKTRNHAPITNYMPTIKQLQKDADFITRLEQAEYAAWKSKVGMWSSPELRAWRKEYVEEEELSKNAISMQNALSWLKKGLNWLRRG
mmetsp:Transcript_9034/g.18647  ORF Transcript_9034/g.18647 Transcript_9034/m.18647 type:complete len:519 (+) Transcript_9034:61-1617(+)